MVMSCISFHVSVCVCVIAGKSVCICVCFPGMQSVLSPVRGL